MSNQINNHEHLDEKWVEWVSKSWGNYCSSCGALKDASKLKVIRKVGPAITLLSECEQCGLKTIMSVVPNVGMQVNQIRTDIAPGEFDKFNGPVTSNDYLDFYTQSKKIHNVSELIKLIDENN